ncbi:MAG: ferritin-like domain-containing protein [Pseudomonadota bacterium]|nr:ferritin-like domain-containing protein [Pseudomonadota bacterium]
MIDTNTVIQVIDAGEKRRIERRRFLRSASQASIAAGGLALLAACGGSSTPTDPGTTTGTPTPSPSSTDQLHDQDVLNFALNLEYLEAQFYLFATTGSGLNASLLTGVGTQGTVVGGRAVTFTDPIVAQYAREIAADELAHVGFLRSLLGGAAVAMPNINIDGSATGAFTAAARKAGVVTSAQTFDPYASDENFLLGAFIFEDVGVTAYKGGSILLNSLIYLDAAAGILATEAYHAGLVRTALYAKGLAMPSLRTQAGQISDARDSLDGSTDDDQGIIGTATASNITPADANGFVYTRTAGQVLNIVYLTNTATVGGGFFPNGLNGNIRTSAAS